MRWMLKTVFCLLFVVALGCGQSGYQSREAAPGAADPSAAMQQMGKGPAPAAPGAAPRK